MKKILFFLFISVPVFLAAQSAGDYRTKAAWGGWTGANTWETWDGSAWVATTKSPTNESGVINIHHNAVDINGNVSFDQLVIHSGGVVRIMINSASNVNLKNGTGDDIVVKKGGELRFITRTAGLAGRLIKETGATMVVESGGIVQIGDGQAPYDLPALLENSAIATTWEDSSYYIWNSNVAPPLAGVTYFPNQPAAKVPIFRLGQSVTTAADPGDIRINGRLELRGASNLTLNHSAGDVYIRDGVITTTSTGLGSGTLIFNTGSHNARKIQFDGQDVQIGAYMTTNQKVAFGGSGSHPTNVSLLQHIRISVGDVVPGDLVISGTSTNPTRINLGAYNLTYSGHPAGVKADVNGYIVTDGVGSFIRDLSVGAGTYLFPVGNSKYYEPAALTFAEPVTGTTMVGRFVTENPGMNGLPLTDNGKEIETVLNYGYWHLNPNPGNSTVTYDGTFTATFAEPFADFSKLHLLKRSNGSDNPWVVSGTHVTTTGTATTAVLRRTGIVGLSEFAVAVAADMGPHVTFSKPGAILKNGVLTVNWASLTERNNVRFDVELSTDGGVNFKKIGSVNTKATNGNSKTSLDYEFQIPISQALAVSAALGLIFLAIGYSRKKRHSLALSLSVAALIIVGVAACSKKDTAPVETKKDYHVRISGIDAEGNVEYSETIKVIAE